MKYSTTPRTLRCTTLWIVCARKSQWPTTERSEPARKTQPFKKVAEKYSSSDVTIISVNWRKDIYSSHTGKPTERLKVHVYLRQPKRKTWWQNACTQD